MVHLSKGVFRFGWSWLSKWWKVIVLVEVVPFEVFLNLFMSKGRTVVIQVFLYLAPITESP